MQRDRSPRFQTATHLQRFAFKESRSLSKYNCRVRTQAHLKVAPSFDPRHEYSQPITRWKSQITRSSTLGPASCLPAAFGLLASVAVPSCPIASRPCVVPNTGQVSIPRMTASTVVMIYGTINRATAWVCSPTDGFAAAQFTPLQPVASPAATAPRGYVLRPSRGTLPSQPAR